MPVDPVQSDPALSLGRAFEVLAFRSGFNTGVVLAGATLLGLAAGVVGVFMLLRKRALLTDALSHATLPGLAVAFLVSAGLGWASRSVPIMLLGAGLSGVLGVVCVQLILRHSRLREDAAIGLVLSVFFGIGVVLLSVIQSHSASGSAGLKSFVYGQAAAMRPADVALMAGLAVVSIGITMACLKEFALVCFNDDFARVGGWPVTAIDMAMMSLAVAVTVAGLQAVGLIMVVALLIIPPVAARFWTDDLRILVVVSGAMGAVSGYLGAAASAVFPESPTGAVIVLTAGCVFTLSMLAAPRRGVVAVLWRRAALRLRVAGDHLLELAHERGDAVLVGSEMRSLARQRAWPAGTRTAVTLSLAARGLVRPRSAAGAGVELTDAGRARGAQVARNHAVWEQYLIGHADVAPSHVDWSVDQVEHVLSEELIAELESELRAQPGAVSGAGRGARSDAQKGESRGA